MIDCFLHSGGFPLFLLLGLSQSLLLDLNEPVLHWSFPRFALGRNVFDQALGIEAEPLGSGNVLVVEAALFLCFLPELFAVCHIITTIERT